MHAISMLIFRRDRYLIGIVLLVQSVVLLHSCFSIVILGISGEDAFDRVSHPQLLLVVTLNIVGRVCRFVRITNLLPNTIFIDIFRRHLCVVPLVQAFVNVLGDF